MQITPLGFIVISLAIFLAIKKPMLLFPLSIVSSIFVGAAVVNIDSTFYPIGLQPFYFVNFIIFIRYIPVKGYHKNFLNRESKYLSLFFKFLLAFVSFSALSVLFSIVFSGMPVLGSRTGIDEIESGNFESLKLSLSTLALIIYLIFNFFYMHFLVRFIEQIENIIDRKKTLSLLFSSYICSGLLVIFFGILQKFCSISGLPFPKEIIYSSIAYNDGGTQTLQHISRVASTFTEPSSAGCFLSAFSMFLFVFIAYSKSLLLKKNIIIVFYFFLSCLTLYFTTSTTGYVTFAVMILFFAVIGFAKLIVIGKVKKGWALKMSASILLLLVLFMIIYSNTDMQFILNEFVLNKSSTSSYVNRSASNEYSIQLLINTFGLGVGLAGHRPSSLLFLIISNLGVLGLFLFIITFIFFPMIFIRGIAGSKNMLNNTTYLDFQIPFHQALWTYFTFLLSMIIANPTLQDASLWINLSLLLSSYACIFKNKSAASAVYK
jgi:hypothetical protein